LLILRNHSFIKLPQSLLRNQTRLLHKTEKDNITYMGLFHNSEELCHAFDGTNNYPSDIPACIKKVDRPERCSPGQQRSQTRCIQRKTR